MALAWAVQAASGALFGITTYYFERNLPDIHGIAVDALLVKIICDVAGFILAVVYRNMIPDGCDEQSLHREFSGARCGNVEFGSFFTLVFLKA